MPRRIAAGTQDQPPQGPAPVYGCLSGGRRLRLLETGIQVIRLSPYHADLPARRPWHLGTATGFLPCYFPLLSFRTPVRHQIQRYLLSSLPAARAIQQCASWRTRGSNRASHSGSSALRTRAWWHRSESTGIPSGRIFVLSLAFGIYTRRTGGGRCEPIVACTCTAISARAWLVSATCPSIPAVLRPALRCVTCRTLTSVLPGSAATR